MQTIMNAENKSGQPLEQNDDEERNKLKKGDTAITEINEVDDKLIGDDLLLKKLVPGEKEGEAKFKEEEANY